MYLFLLICFNAYLKHINKHKHMVSQSDSKIFNQKARSHSESISNVRSTDKRPMQSKHNG